jgi:hypothetical protein
MITSSIQRRFLVVTFAFFAWVSHATADTSALRQLRNEAKFNETVLSVPPPLDGAAVAE